jgi:3'-phosphoadenosine 5'-phosphosulfate sulfotransferase (PAPS reductase)/FAD synthetase
MATLTTTPSLPGVAITPDVRAARRAGAAVAIGVSGGKDSSAAALATVRHLDAIGHTGPRLLVHADLGRTEWAESLPTCEALARRLGLELLVVRRQAGDMLARWQGRWANNVQRYAELSCVKLILPWSTASMRFCTSELKTAPICTALSKRFRGLPIVNVTGICRRESPNRAKSPVSAPNARLGAQGLDWRPILDWTLDQVWAAHRDHDLPVHPGYTDYGVSRISCSYCILASRDDLARAATHPGNAELYRAMVDLELESTFSFQDRQWLADIRPELLTEPQRAAVAEAKARAARRQAAERQIPKHLEYTQGWPTCRPTAAEARLLADVRANVADAVGLAVGYTDPITIRDRYEALMAGRPAVSTLVQEVLL